MCLLQVICYISSSSPHQNLHYSSIYFFTYHSQPECHFHSIKAIPNLHFNHTFTISKLPFVNPNPSSTWILADLVLRASWENWIPIDKTIPSPETWVFSHSKNLILKSVLLFSLVNHVSNLLRMLESTLLAFFLRIWWGCWPFQKIKEVQR